MGIVRLFKFAFTVIILVHLIACFWYYVAVFEDLNDDTWVTMYGIKDSDKLYKYIASLYWVFTTLTTVGFGDILPGTISEKIFAICWMTFGVAFYSYTIGSLSTIMANMD